MQKKIYVTGMDDDATANKVNEAVKAIAGVTDAVATPAKCQVLVDYAEGTAGIEDAITKAISDAGVMVLG